MKKVIREIKNEKLTWALTDADGTEKEFQSFAEYCSYISANFDTLKNVKQKTELSIEVPAV